MNYDGALEASKHNPEEVNKVLEGLEWDCKECNVTGYVGMTAKGCGSMKCPTCRGKGVLKYSWTPQVGEWCACGHYGLGLIIKVREEQWLTIHNNTHELHKDNGTPILPWEEIERVLEKAGYVFKPPIYFYGENRRNRIYHVCINGCHYETGKSYQEAVMKAVIELGKEIKQ